MKRTVRWLAVLYLVALLVLWGFIHFDTGSVWVVTLFLFSPRWAVATPLIVLVPLTLAVQYRLTPAYVVHALVILFPIMGYGVSFTPSETRIADASLSVMTCNLGGGNIDIGQLTAIARTHGIDVLVLQECPRELSNLVFEQLGWIHRHEPKLAIGSRYELGELQVFARHPPDQANMAAAVCCQLTLPAGADVRSQDDHLLRTDTSVNIVAVHFPTFRPALERAKALDPDTGTAIADLGRMYCGVVESVPRQIRDSGHPTIVTGDFNVPVDSTYYRRFWSEYRNVLSTVSTGLRYTKHTQLHGIRIDHVLTDSNWIAESAIVGPDTGGDHRPVIAKVSLAR